MWPIVQQDVIEKDGDKAWRCVICFPLLLSTRLDPCQTFRLRNGLTNIPSIFSYYYREAYKWYLDA